MTHQAAEPADPVEVQELLQRFEETHYRLVLQPALKQSAEALRWVLFFHRISVNVFPPLPRRDFL